MEAKELINNLMIGDWFRGPDPTPIRITRIDSRGMLVENQDTDEVGLEDLQPIPLTEDILLKNGFYVYSKDDYSEAKLDVKIDNLEYQICGTRKADKWHISIYKIKWEDRTKGKYNSCCLFSSGIFGEYDQIYVHEMQHSLRQCGLSDMADKLKIE